MESKNRVAREHRPLVIRPFLYCMADLIRLTRIDDPKGFEARCYLDALV